MQSYIIGQCVMVWVDVSYWIEGLENLDWNWIQIQDVVFDWIDSYTPGSKEYQICFYSCHWIVGVPCLVSVIDGFMRST